MAMSDGSLN